jgi:hypothetical protein
MVPEEVTRMKKITVLLMSLVLIAFMGLSVSATSNEPTPIDPILVDPKPEEPIVVDPIIVIDDGEVINPCGENIEVCIATTGEGFSEGTVGTDEEVKICTINENGEESCDIEAIHLGEKPLDNMTDETPVDCEKDPTVCQRTEDGIETLMPTDGKYEDGIYYMTGTNDLDTQDKSMTTIAVIGSTLGLIVVGLAINLKLRKN